MTVKRIREELQTLRNELAGPERVDGRSAKIELEARIDRIAAHCSASGLKVTAAQSEELSAWWTARFGRVMS